MDIDKNKLNNLASTWMSEFSTTETKRQLYETEWMNSLRQYKGFHDPEIVFEQNESKIYSHYTRSKVTPLKAKLNQTLLSTKNKNWEIYPTPKPRIDDLFLQQIIQQNVTKDPQGNIIMPDPKFIEGEIYKFAEEKTNNMSKLMNDQHVEGKRQGVQKDIIRSFILYGTGIEKGPTVKEIKEYEVINTENRYTQNQTVRIMPVSYFVPLWKWYPDYTSVNIDDCNYVYELYPLTKHEMRKLLDKDYFFADIIQTILKDKKNGNYKVRNWENELQTLDENKNTSADLSQNYEVVKRFGYVDAEDLIEANVINQEDETIPKQEEYLCDAWLCDNKIIKLVISPFFEDISDLYHITYFEKDETSIFGTGLPKILRDRQLAINRGESNLLGHLAWLKKPCGEINLSRLHPDSAKHADTFTPGKFYGYFDDTQSSRNILSLYYMQDNSRSFINAIEFFKIQGDLESSLPSTLFGLASPSADETARAFSGRMSNLIDFIKDIATNFDNANISYLMSQYKWNMKYHTDDSVKGDMEIKAVGSTASLVKSILVENIGFILQSIPQEIRERTKIYEFGKELFGAIFENPEKFLMTDEEYDKLKAPVVQKQMEFEQLNKELLKVKGELDIAKAEKMKAMAEKTLTDIPIKKDKAQLDNQKILAEVKQIVTDTIEKQMGMMVKKLEKHE